MSRTSVKILMLLSALTFITCSNDEDCVWNYKCCSFKEVNGEVTCEKMCEPEINCDVKNQSDVDDLNNDVEVFNGDIPFMPASLKTMRCRQGFTFYNHKCRRVFGRPKDI